MGSNLHRYATVVKPPTQITRQVALGLVEPAMILRFSGSRDSVMFGQTILTFQSFLTSPKLSHVL